MDNQRFTPKCVIKCVTVDFKTPLKALYKAVFHLITIYSGLRNNYILT